VNKADHIACKIEQTFTGFVYTFTKLKDTRFPPLWSAVEPDDARSHFDFLWSRAPAGWAIRR